MYTKEIGAYKNIISLFRFAKYLEYYRRAAIAVHLINGITLLALFD